MGCRAVADRPADRPTDRPAGRGVVGVIGPTIPSDHRIQPVTLPIDIVRLDPDLPLPTYAHHGDAGVDLHARHDVTLVRAGGRQLMPTGIAIAIPVGWCGLVMPRSGLAVKHGISVVNAPGLIDAAYRGEIKVVLVNTDPDHDYDITRGDRIAQLVVQRVDQVEWRVVDGLDGVDRGGGFGHSGR